MLLRKHILAYVIAQHHKLSLPLPCLAGTSAHASFLPGTRPHRRSDSIYPKTLTAVNTRELDAPWHGHEHHGVVYSNKLPLNHDITTLPDL
jgi:hypothetical protein